MKIAGKVPGINRGVIEFHRPGGEVFRLIVQAVPYGFPERVEREIPAPEPPVEFAKDPKSGAVLRDESGMALKVERKSDAAYQRELGRVRALRVVLQVREALRSDPNILFDADGDSKLKGRAYAQKVEEEFAAAGFTDSEIIAIFNKSLELNRGAAQRVDEAAERFLSETPSAPAGNSPSAPAEVSGT
jgi:hypothetical protein